MTTRKICVVVTARPSYSPHQDRARRRSPRIPTSSCSSSSPRRRCSIATATRSRSSSTTAFRSPRASTWCSRARTCVTSAKSTGLGLLELATVFDNLKPDVVVTVADRYETLATAVAASYMNIPRRARAGRRGHRLDRREGPPRGHQAVESPPRLDEAGGRTRDRSWARSRTSVHRHRLPVDRPRGARSPRSPRSTSIRSRSTAASARRVDLSKGYLVVMQHPVTTEYERSAAAGRRDAVRGEGPRPAGAVVLAQRRRRLRRHVEGHPRLPREARSRTNIHFFQNMFPEDFLRLLCNATAIVGNSSVGDPRVLVPRRAGREHRLAAAGPRARRERDRRRARSRGDRRRDSRAHPARPAAARSSLRRRQRRRADRRLPRHRAAHDRKAADLLMQTDACPTHDRRQRIAGARLRLRRAAAEQALNSCNLCGADVLVVAHAARSLRLPGAGAVPAAAAAWCSSTRA